MKTLVAFVLSLAAFPSLAQSQASKLLLENPEVRMSRYIIDPQKPLTLSFSDGDGVIVPIQPLKWSAAVQTNSEWQAGAGEALFFSQGAKPEVYSGEGTPATLIASELKHHWTSTLRKCEESKRQCARPIKVEERVIGETRSLFTNNYVSAYRHELDRGGTLTSSYFTSHGSDHVLLIALTPLTANLSGEEIKLEAEQAYFSTAQEVEANANNGRAVWVAIRIHAADSNP